MPRNLARTVCLALVFFFFNFRFLFSLHFYVALQEFALKMQHWHFAMRLVLERVCV